MYSVPYGVEAITEEEYRYVGGVMEGGTELSKPENSSAGLFLYI
jgi:hypothetical protein